MLRAQRKSRTSNSAPVPMVCEVCRSQPVEAVVADFNPEQDLHLLLPGMSVEPQVSAMTAIGSWSVGINVSLIAIFRSRKGRI